MSRLRILAFALTALLLAVLSYACAEGDALEGDGAPSSEEVDGGAREAGPGLPSDDAASSGPDATPQDASGPDATAGDGGSDAGPDAAGDAGSTPFDGGVTPEVGDGGTFMVLRIGADDGGTLVSNATPVFVEERRVDDGTLTRTIALPVAANGAQRPFTLRGTATTEGALRLGADGRHVVAAGYAATPGTADIATSSSATIPRVVARIDAAGVVDTSTTLNAAFSTASVRGAATHDGSTFWVSGEDGNGASGGIYAIALGATGGTQVFGTVQNLRTVGIFGGQLHASTVSGTSGNTLRIFSVGAGLPLTPDQVGTALPGVTTAGTTPHGFVLLDLDAGEPGTDTMYVADTRPTASGGGVQKWKRAGGTWTRTATFASGLTAAPLDVTAARSGGDVVVLCVTLDAQPRVVRFVDDGVDLDPAGVTLATSSSATLYRGVAIAPR